MGWMNKLDLPYIVEALREATGHADLIVSIFPDKDDLVVYWKVPGKRNNRFDVPGPVTYLDHKLLVQWFTDELNWYTGWLGGRSWER